MKKIGVETLFIKESINKLMKIYKKMVVLNYDFAKEAGDARRNQVYEEIMQLIETLKKLNNEV